MENTTIARASAVRGGGVFLDPYYPNPSTSANSNAKVTGDGRAVFTDCHATLDGGGLFTNVYSDDFDDPFDERISGWEEGNDLVTGLVFNGCSAGRSVLRP